MSKPRKVEEAKGVYATPSKHVAHTPSAGPKSGPRYVDAVTAEKLADKLFTERKSLLRKLAQ